MEFEKIKNKYNDSKLKGEKFDLEFSIRFDSIRLFVRWLSHAFFNWSVAWIVGSLYKTLLGNIDEHLKMHAPKNEI